jgi:hypothetical protein
MHNNQISLGVPWIKGCRIYDPKTQGFFTFGVFLEPLAATIAHSCAANSWVLHEGKEMRLRASKDIAAGEELTLCRAPGEGGFQIRQGNL